MGGGDDGVEWDRLGCGERFRISTFLGRSVFDLRLLWVYAWNNSVVAGQRETPGRKLPEEVLAITSFSNQKVRQRGGVMKDGEKLVIVGCSGSGGPAAMMAKKLMPSVDVTVIRKEEFFIVR